MRAEVGGKKALPIHREKFPDRYVENYTMVGPDSLPASSARRALAYVYFEEEPGGEFALA
jgi:hypothetical protein